MTLTLGFSPCPNDTFIFDALVNGRLDTRGLHVEPVLEDVETLNRWAAQGRLDVTKLSFHAFLHQAHRYALLRSGSALGKGVGPLLVARGPIDASKIRDCRIAIPGINTTANLLFSLAFPQARHKEEIVFSEIEAAVLDGRFDAGLVIHESRFTYAQKGLVKLVDLGDWWEQNAAAPIPLGGIALRRDHSQDVYDAVNALIRESLALAWAAHPALSPYVVRHAQEMDEAVMRQHIGLYVNGFTDDLGPEGVRAVEVLFQKAGQAGLIEEAAPKIFY